MDMTVVGAGALGLSAALALAEAGHDVTVLEQDTAGSGATGRAAGILSTMTWHDDEYHLIAETRGRIGELISMAMIEGSPAARHVWKPYDSITIASGPGLRHLDAMQERLERNTEEPERLDHRAAAAAYPRMEFFPGEEVLVAQEDGAIEAGDLVQVLLDRLAAEGVIVRQGSPVQDRPDGAVVVAGGAWTGGLLRAWGHPLPLQAFRTQLASLEIPDAETLPMVHDAAQGCYIRPESTTSMLAGDGTVLEPHDPDSYDQQADAGFLTSIAQRVTRRFLDGGEARLRSAWAGLCVGTPDRRPLCGAVPGTDDLWVLTGDNGFGLMRCLALGDRLADAVDGRRHADLDPGRFGPDAPLVFPMQEGYGFT